MTTAIVCSAILAASIFVLGFNVTRVRGVVGKAGGNQQPTDPADRLLIAQRAHGNASEYVPSLIAMFLIVGWLSPTPWGLTLIVGATVSRIAHAYLMLASQSLAEEFMRRMLASMGTYVFGVLLAVTAAVAAF
ncbi:MAG TPA: MAPEG family protein [Nocardioidaceae bacterium]|nr:MAPEG family protein [Nocardioidaceae bacterium]